MIGGIFSAFIGGILVFGIGISIGWSMRGSVKEQELQRYRTIHEDIQKLDWKIDDFNKKVK